MAETSVFWLFSGALEDSKIARRLPCDIGEKKPAMMYVPTKQGAKSAKEPHNPQNPRVLKCWKLEAVFLERNMLIPRNAWSFIGSV